MLLGKLEQVDIWRLIPATGTGNWGGPTYTYHHTEWMTVQPFEASDGIRNSQRFSNTKSLLFADVDADVCEEDELIFKNKYERIGYLQEYDGELFSHLEVYTTDTQFDRNP